jgi:hypothetical protein
VWCGIPSGPSGLKLSSTSSSMSYSLVTPPRVIMLTRTVVLACYLLCRSQVSESAWSCGMSSLIHW